MLNLILAIIREATFQTSTEYVSIRDIKEMIVLEHHAGTHRSTCGVIVSQGIF